jgi:hypothetical protein
VNTYGINNLVHLSVQFTQLVGNTPIDPTTITLLVRAPDQTIATYTYAASQIIRDGVGAYHYDLDVTQTGYYNYQFEGGGNLICQSNDQFQSLPSPFGSL